MQFISFDGIGTWGEKRFANISLPNDCRYIAFNAHSRGGEGEKTQLTIFNSPTGITVVPRIPEPQAADPVWNWLLNKRQTLIETKKVLKVDPNWQDILYSIVYYVTKLKDPGRRATGYLPQLATPSNLGAIGAIGVLCIGQKVDYKDIDTTMIHPDTEVESVQILLKKGWDVAQKIKETFHDEAFDIYPIMIGTEDKKLWLLELPPEIAITNKIPPYLSILYIPAGTSPLTGLLGTWKLFNEDITADITAKTKITIQEIQKITERHKLIQGRKRQTVW